MIAANAKIERLMLAIAEHEGWDPPGPKTPPGGSRSYRNHNPGNLRTSPFSYATVDGFAAFRSDFVGFMALHWDLMQKARGNTVTGLNGQSTVRDLIYTWAPPSDNNDTESYLHAVIKKTGFQEITTLTEIFDF
jgi:hypothetical protein